MAGYLLFIPFWLWLKYQEAARWVKRKFSGR